MRGSIVWLKRERPVKPFERFLAVARHGDLRVWQSAQIQIIGV
jgi:hypothetical protein